MKKVSDLETFLVELSRFLFSKTILFYSEYRFDQIIHHSSLNK